MYRLLIVIGLIVAYLLIWNTHCYFKCKSLYSEYVNYASCVSSGKQYDGDITYKKLQIIRLFNDAGVSNPHIPTTIPTGYGMAANTSINVFENMFYNDRLVLAALMQSFETAIGEYRSRIVESISPLYWVRTIVFLPKKIFNYLGIESDKLPTKIFQVIYWIVTVLYAIYSDSINPIIQNFLSNLFNK